jgi:hypothetical protein
MLMNILNLAAIVGLLLALPASAAAPAGKCTYQTWEWDRAKKMSVNRRTVSKERSALDIEERGELSGCTVCEQDQTEIKIAGLRSFFACRALAPKITRALETARDSGFPIKSLVGYRVGKSRGPIDANGLRTQFSNHSYGTAVDINSEINGLYENCLAFGPACRLLRGGPWVAERPGTITRGSVVYRAMLEAGFKWGGEIQAKQKDFMHFSLSGM